MTTLKQFPWQPTHILTIPDGPDGATREIKLQCSERADRTGYLLFTPEEWQRACSEGCHQVRPLFETAWQLSLKGKVMLGNAITGKHVVDAALRGISER